MPQTTPQAPNASRDDAILYPSAYFAGWGSRSLGAHGRVKDIASRNAGVVTVTRTCKVALWEPAFSEVNSYFDQDSVAGTKIFINGS